MINPVQKIAIKGVEVELLITPSMFKKDLTRGIDLICHCADDAAEVWQIYVKLIYLAYLNMLDVKRYEGKEIGSQLEFLDFEVWASGEGKERFGRLAEDIIILKTGKTIEEILKSAKKKEGGD